MSLSFRCIVGMSLPHFRVSWPWWCRRRGDRVSDQIEIRGLISHFATEKTTSTHLSRLPIDCKRLPESFDVAAPSMNLHTQIHSTFSRPCHARPVSQAQLSRLPSDIASKRSWGRRRQHQFDTACAEVPERPQVGSPSQAVQNCCSSLMFVN